MFTTLYYFSERVLALAGRFTNLHKVAAEAY
jgi:hypothetical protein